MFLEPTSVNFANDVYEMYQVQQQVSSIMVVLCLKDIHVLKRSDYSMSFCLPFMNVVADRPFKSERRHRFFYLVSTTGEVNMQGSALDKIPQLNQFKPIIRTDITGDK